jgi:hypothetical protein
MMTPSIGLQVPVRFCLYDDVADEYVVDAAWFAQPRTNHNHTPVRLTVIQKDKADGMPQEAESLKSLPEAQPDATIFELLTSRQVLVAALERIAKVSNSEWIVEIAEDALSAYRGDAK